LQRVGLPQNQTQIKPLWLNNKNPTRPLSLSLSIFSSLRSLSLSHTLPHGDILDAPAFQASAIWSPLSWSESLERAAAQPFGIGAKNIKKLNLQVFYIV